MIIQTPLEGLDSSLDELMSNPDYCLQEKKNGNRVLVKKAGHLVVGFNRLGGVTGIPAVIENVMIFLEDDFIVDGEIVGDHYYIFDIISLNNEIVSSLTFVDRQKLITNLLYGKSSVLSSVSQLGCDYAETSKQSSLEFYRKKWNQNKDKVDFDGVVFKDIHGEYLRGKSNLCIKYNFKKKKKFIVISASEDKICFGGLTSVKLDNLSVVAIGEVDRGDNLGLSILHAGDIIEVEYAEEKDPMDTKKMKCSVIVPKSWRRRYDVLLSECLLSQMNSPLV